MTTLRSTITVASVLTGLQFMGCIICGDGVFAYEASLTVVDSTGQPVPDAEILLGYYEEDDPALYDSTSEAFATTDSEGHVTTTACTGLAWGGCMLESQWLTYEAPVPTVPDQLYLWVRIGSGECKQYTLQVVAENVIASEPAHMTLDLGTVPIESE
jgi:hypothetical protein